MELEAIVRGLQATRDIGTNLQALNAFRRSLAASPSFLNEFLARSTFDVFQHIWDAQISHKDHGVTVTLLLCIADILTTSSSHQSPCIKTAADYLATTTLSRRLKPLYFLLSSESKGRINAALTLLAALVSFSPSTAADIIRTFDFTLSALPSIARPVSKKNNYKRKAAAVAAPPPPTSQHNETDNNNSTGKNALSNQWKDPDPLKRPTRANFIKFALALLKASSPQPLLLSTLITQHRQITGGLLHHLASDPPEVQYRVLNRLQKTVLSADSGGLAPVSKAAVFTDAAMSQLTAIASSSTNSTISIAEEEEVEDAGELAKDILLMACCQPSLGLCDNATSKTPPLYAIKGAFQPMQLSSGMKTLYRWLRTLRPSDSAVQGGLLDSCIQSNPVLATALLSSPSLPWSLDQPAASRRWLANATSAHILLLTIANYNAGILSVDENNTTNKNGGGGLSSGIVREIISPGILPPIRIISRSALSRGVQHSNALVKHSTLCLLCSALDVSLKLIREVEALGMVDVADKVRQMVRGSMPDPQSVLAVLLSNNSNNSSGGDGDHKEEEDDDDDEGNNNKKKSNDDDNDTKVKSSKMMLVGMCLKTFVKWQNVLPNVFVESSIDVERLVPCHLAALPPNTQYGYLELIGQVVTTTISKSSSKSIIPITSTTPLMPILQTLVNPAVSKEVCSMAVEVLTQRLLATGGFEKMYEDEAQLYFQALNVVEWKEETMASLLSSGVAASGVLTFLCEAVLLLMRRPHDIYEQTMQHITALNGAAVAQSSSSSSFSLLGPCLLRQALRVLPSEKTNVQDRLAIAAYTKSVLVAILQQQYIDVKPYASVLLGIIKDEAVRQQEQQAKVNVESTTDSSGSVVLPEEGRQLSELEELLHTFTGGRRYDIDSKPQEHKKKKMKLSNGHHHHHHLRHHHRHQENNGSSPRLLIKIVSSPTATSKNRSSPPPPTTTISSSNNMHVYRPMMAPLVQSLAFDEDDAKASQHLATLLNTVLQPKNNNAFTVYHVLRHCLFWLSQYTTKPSRQLEKTNIEGLFVVIKACMSVSTTTTTGTSNAQVNKEMCLAIISSSPVILSTLQSTTDDDDAISNLIHYGVVSVLKSFITASQSHYSSSVYNTALVKCLVDGFTQQLRNLSDSSKDEAAARGEGGEAPRCVRTFIELLPLIPRQDIKAATEQALQLVSNFNSGNNISHYHWLLNATASLLEEQQQQQDGGEGDTAWIQDTVLPILCQSLGALHPSPLDTVLARILSNPRMRATYFGASNIINNNDKKQGYSQEEVLIKAAIDVPTEERCVIAIAVLKQYPSHLEAVARELTRKMVECSYDADGTEKKKKKKKHKTKADGEHQKDCIAYLPLCVYILKQQQQQQPASSSIVEKNKNEKESSAARVELANAVATVLHSYFTNTKSDSNSNSFHAGILKRYAVAALTASLQASPSSVSALLQQLTATSKSTTNEEGFIAALMPKEGWKVSRNDEEEDCSTVADNCEKASLALMFLAISTSLTTIQLLPYIAAFSSTLGRVYKAGLPGDKKKVTTTSAVTPSSSSSSSSFLERVLMQGLDGSLGDAVAALSLEQRRSTEAFVKLAHIACCKLAPEILKHRSSDVSSICTLRRFIAALLPEEREWTEKDHHCRRQQKEGSEEAVGRSAMHLLELLTCHSQFLPTLQCTADSPAPLAPAARALPRPLESIILVLATDECIRTSRVNTLVEENRKHLKRNYCELMQTLLDLALLAPQSSAPFTKALEVCKHWLPVIMAAYGGSLSIADKAVWSLARLLNTTVYMYGDDTAMVDANKNWDIVSLFDGPLAKSGYVWGPEALKQLSKKKKERSADYDDSNDAYVDVLSKIDPVRCGLTVALYPEECTLLGGGGGGGEKSIETITTTSSHDNSSAISLQQLPYANGGYDPSFILPLSLFLLKSKAVEPRHFVQLGLLSVTLRCLASADAPLRAMAYEIVALYKQQLMDDECNFKEKQQLIVALNALQVAITTPFSRLSSCHAVFLAEAATLALNPGHPMFSPVNKYLLKQHALDLSDDIPLFNRMMLSGSQQSREERTWLLSLLISGLRSSEDAYLYKKKHVVELVMSLHDALPANSASVSLCFQLIRRVPCVPRAAKFVFDTCGGSSWLGAIICKSIVTAMTGDNSSNNNGNNENLSTALDACGTLYNLTQLKSVMRGPGSWLGAAHDLMVVSRNILHTILSLHSADQKRYGNYGTSAVSNNAIGNKAIIKECIIKVLRVMLAAGRHRRSGGLGAGIGAGEVQELEDGFIVVRRSGDGSRNNTHSGSTAAHDDTRLIEVLNALYEIAD